MKKYKKVTHIEVSDGDTLFISVEECPLTDREIDDRSDQVKNNTVCCINSDTGVRCGHLYSLVEDSGVKYIQCTRMSERSSIDTPVPFTRLNNKTLESLGFQKPKFLNPESSIEVLKTYTHDLIGEIIIGAIHRVDEMGVKYITLSKWKGDSGVCIFSEDKDIALYIDLIKIKG